ncbi:RsmE family RNA methyltransferase [Rubellicoccus peritrichatus]|uniref:Ribosomal RNA small subunit methyltransferase E n=1 Tax=Rubellicoccus peritrichatus TaxID=3080537 RepID=A0AAQ3LB31_9BACT|nr:RsmE family RNA methyltransferase [Puniceicoccus sp. CR14]WOO42441.1 RsmE family RNA methyltransferase [Puniceicoccus sp. CR14]
MAGLRAFYDGEIPNSGASLRLNPDESRHLVRALRVRPGEKVELLNGMGARISTVFECEVQKMAELKVEKVTSEAKSSVEITLIQGLPKGKTFDSIIRQATEIGVHRIIPLMSDYSEVRLDSARAENKRAHWQTTAREACKQCGNPWLPEISMPMKLKSVLGGLFDDSTRIVASLQPGSVQIIERSDLLRKASSVVIAIGPEGDFSEAEYSLLSEHSFHPVKLARQILRSDTAATYLLSIVEALTAH